MDRRIYDLAIIGGGSAGLTAARFAVQLGVRVALLERDRIGGDCTWTGCVPSKTLLRVAKVAHGMRTAGRYGLTPFETEVDLRRVMQHVRAVIAKIYQEETPDALRAEGVDVFLGKAHFLDPHTIAVGKSNLTARRIVLATGAHPLIPPIAGLDDVNYLTYETIWELEALPRHLLIVGGGPIGCETAQAFRRLGAEVTLLEEGERLLPRDEPAASAVLAEVLTREGIEVRSHAPAKRIWQDESGIHVMAGSDELVGNSLLLAVGRRPNVDELRLERAGVRYSSNGIEVNDNLCTSQRHIYAAGDCIGSHQFAHYAGWQAFMAARNALLPGASKGVRQRVPWTTFTDPEIARAGLTEAQAKERFGNAVMTSLWPMERVDRAVTEGAVDGFLKLIYRRDGTLLGVTIVAGRAGEMIHEWVLALERGLKVGDLSSIIHIYPTYSTASMQMAAAIRTEQMLSGMSGRIIRAMAGLVR